MQERKHYGQHAAYDGKVCEQPGRAGGREDSTVHGGEEKVRHVALQHDACVSLSRFFHSNLIILTEKQHVVSYYAADVMYSQLFITQRYCYICEPYYACTFCLVTR